MTNYTNKLLIAALATLGLAIGAPSADAASVPTKMKCGKNMQQQIECDDFKAACLRAGHAVTVTTDGGGYIEEVACWNKGGPFDK